MVNKKHVSKKMNRGGHSTQSHRSVADSQVEMTQLVLPNDTNQLENLLGGRLMEWIDIAAAIAAQRHSNRICVTAAVDNLVFHNPIKLGEVVTLEASVNRAFGTSVEVGVHVEAENQLTRERKLATTAYLTFVAVDGFGNPLKVPPIHPQSSIERRRYKEALERRLERLRSKENRAKKRG
ncbi:MAG TPA: acyl-CoA thioesterase [Bacteroidota bacterium]|nr:acyl-CoA thioesterase [Bacteroidota bacterium]